MCLMVWVGSVQALPVEPQSVEAGGDDWFGAVPRVTEPAIRARLSSPHVTFVRANTGCGCGFDSGWLSEMGFETFEDASNQLDRLEQDDVDDLRSRQASRERLANLIEGALRDGAVEVFCCWAGDEAEPTLRVDEVDAEHFRTKLRPLEERVHYQLHRLG